MRIVRRPWSALLVLAMLPVAAHAQQPESGLDEAARLARGGGGLRAGIWDVQMHAAAERSPAFEAYFQRGLDGKLAVENSIGVWWVETTTTQVTGDVAIKSYVVPLLTSLKFFPFTDVTDRLEPFVMAGAGFTLGVEDEDEAAIGGGGTSLVTGFGVRAAAGLALNLGRSFALSANAKYQWVRFGQPLGGQDGFSGLGLEGGVAYRFQR